MSYFSFDFGKEQYDVAVSCMTLYHFNHEEKISLYTKIHQSLITGGRYIECDYMVEDQGQEDYYYAENKRIRQEHGIAEGFYHYDTPCTVENQIMMLHQAGFQKIEKVWQHGNTVILVSVK